MKENVCYINQDTSQDKPRHAKARVARSSMHNIRPVEAINMARETPNFVYFASFFDKNTLRMC
jgi:hypothetical protein